MLLPKEPTTEAVAPEDKPLGPARPTVTEEDSSRERRLSIEPKGVIPLGKRSEKKTNEVGEAPAKNPPLV